jgi:lipoprotein-anchoring transpeptidase ErfK/SrfK
MLQSEESVKGVRMAFNRRQVLAAAAGTATWAIGAPAFAVSEEHYFNGTAEDNGFTYRRTNMSAIDPSLRRQLVKYQHNELPGTIVVDTRAHFLYVAFENNTALRYGVGVGKEGFQWFGRAQIDRKQLWPEWIPPPEMLKRRPELPRHMDGGPENPLGPRAMYLYRDGVDLGYRLHGTVEPWSIGGDVSSGCIRLLPEDVIDLYQRSPVGTAVLVLEHLR